MGIGKGKSDKINIDGLIESTNNESKILQVERSFTENIAELKQTTAVSMPLLTVWKASFQNSTHLLKKCR